MKKSPIASLWPVLISTAFVFLVVGLTHVQEASGQKKKSKVDNSVSSLFVSDLDADNAPDVLLISPKSGEVVWYQNSKKRGNFTKRNVITGKVRLGKSVFADDLDGDGDRDVISVSSLDNKVAWYKNTDGYGTFAEQQTFVKEAGSPYAVYADDFDGDDDNDVLFASNADGKIAWCVNEENSFSSPNVISTNVSGARSVHAADIDGDGDEDALSASSSFGGDNKIAWYRNTAGGFASQNIISKKIKGARAVLGTDLDGDGDQDVLSASAGDGKIAWYENTDGYGTFSKQKVITKKSPGARSVSVADFDGDGDRDVLSASNKKGKIAWYENIDGNKKFSDMKVITKKQNYKTAFVKDVDVDGDPDVVFVSSSKSKVAWCSNRIEEGKGFSKPKVIGPK